MAELKCSPCVAFNHTLFWDISDCRCDLTEARPAGWFYECRSSQPHVALTDKWSCAADTEINGLLTDAYLTLNMFKVLYFYVNFSNYNFIYTTKGFFIHLTFFVSALVFFFSFFITRRSLWYSQFFPFSITFVRRGVVSSQIFLQWHVM